MNKSNHVDTRLSNNYMKINRVAEYINQKFFDGKICYVVCNTDKVVATPFNTDIVEVEHFKSKYIVDINYERAITDKYYLANQIFTSFICYKLNMVGLIGTKNYYYRTKRRFGVEAENLGCHVNYDTKYGCEIESPPDDVIDFLDSISFDIPNFYTNNDVVASKPKGSNSIKWICPKCGNIARTTRIMNLMCGDCMEKLIRQ